MSYQGYLLKFGSTEFPMEYIEFGKYKATPKQRQDLDAYQDGDGNLHRNVVSHDRSKIIVPLLPLTLEQKMEVQSVINGAMSDDRERKCTVEYWDDENNTYSSGDFYIPDIEFPIKRATDDTIWYDRFEIHLIEY